MNAFHVNSTGPYFASGKKEPYSIEKFSLYTTVISALCWRRMNGGILMATDKTGKRLYDESGLSRVWDSVLDIIPDDLEGIDPLVFWAAGKLIALRELDSDAALVDEDLIVWKKLKLSDKKVTAAHREYITPEIYPDPGVFGVDFPLLDRLDRNVMPCNTAFLYIPDRSLRLFYVNQSIAFMKAASGRCTQDRLRPMVFAEQRLLAMLCAYTGTEINTLLDVNKLFIAQDDYTHLWGAKQAMRDNDDYRNGFIERCRRRIENDFPEYADIIGIIEEYGR